MKRSPLKRSRTPINAASERTRAARKRRTAPRDEQLRKYPLCEAKAAGMPHQCYGVRTVHEPWTRARGGPIDDPRNMTTVCAHGNTLISQDSGCMAWAKDNGFLVSASQGARWLAAGGFLRQ